MFSLISHHYKYAASARQFLLNPHSELITAVNKVAHVPKAVRCYHVKAFLRPSSYWERLNGSVSERPHGQVLSIQQNRVISTWHTHLSGDLWGSSSRVRMIPLGYKLQVGLTALLKHCAELQIWELWLLSLGIGWQPTRTVQNVTQCFSVAECVTRQYSGGQLCGCVFLLPVHPVNAPCYCPRSFCVMTVVWPGEWWFNIGPSWVGVHTTTAHTNTGQQASPSQMKTSHRNSE